VGPACPAWESSTWPSRTGHPPTAPVAGCTSPGSDPRTRRSCERSPCSTRSTRHGSHACSVARRYERNAILFLKGEPATRIFVVLEGWIRLFRETPEGQESTIGVFGQGESVAEAAVFDSGDYPVSCMVVSRARLLTVPAGNFLEQIRQSPELALNLLGSMSRHLRRLVRQVEQLTNRSSLERLADFLLRLCPPGEPRAEIELPLDKVLVAARLGMQPETLYRSLARLRDAGVETRGSQIVVNDVARLGRLAHGRRAS
jgi:CRP/FNR family transcriptional regulator, dissimilatory nitrate respiration regulator